MMLTKSKNCSDKQVIKVSLPWTYGDTWNEVCAWAVEQFGLPGDKFNFIPGENCMEFYFKDEKDAIHLMLRWS